MVGAPLAEGDDDHGAEGEDDDGGFEGGVGLGLGFEAEGAIVTCERTDSMNVKSRSDLRWGSASATGQVMLRWSEVSQIAEWQPGHDPYGEGDDDGDMGQYGRVPRSFVPTVQDVQAEGNAHDTGSGHVSE